MQTLQINVFKFNELNEEAQEKAILKAYKNRKFANLLKKYDPIAFNQLN